MHALMEFQSCETDEKPDMGLTSKTNYHRLCSTFLSKVGHSDLILLR